jgi:hypothetical protein
MGKKAFAIVLFLILQFDNTSFSQTRHEMDIVTGLGFPSDFLHLGLRYQIAIQNQLGFIFGYDILFRDNSIDERMFSLSLDHYWHFGGHSSKSEIKPWYFRQGLNYMQDKTEYELFRLFGLNLSAGREISFSRHFGLNIDLGVIPNINTLKELKPKPCTFCFDIAFPNIFPNARLDFFYRIY